MTNFKVMSIFKILKLNMQAVFKFVRIKNIAR